MLPYINVCCTLVIHAIHVASKVVIVPALVVSGADIRIEGRSGRTSCSANNISSSSCSSRS